MRPIEETLGKSLDTRDKAIGCILGGAIGDALGGAYEGHQGPVVVDPTIAWRISDDTQLTLATCEAICAAGELSPDRVAERFLAWYRAGRLSGLGASTLKALRDLDAGAHWAMSGRRGEMAAGNGAAMRAAPLAFVIDPTNPVQRTMLRDICRITHHSDEAYSGALAVVESVRSVVWGAWKPGENLPHRVAASLPDSVVRDTLGAYGELPCESSLETVAERFGSSGFVAESVPLAIFAAHKIPDLGFQEMLTQVISVGGDTDTTASMAGQIAGAWLGADRIPGELVRRIPDIDSILHAAQLFAEKIAKSGRPPSSA